jgi:predicted transcriptional regulator
MKRMKIGVKSVAEQRQRTLAIASGEFKPMPDDPKVWFPSVAAMARVMSDENMAMLKIIRETQPASVTALARAAGKQTPNVSRSLLAMEQFGLVRLVQKGRTKKPEATADEIVVLFA